MSERTRGNTVLFSFQKKDIPAIHYIFGTMHTRNAGAYTHADLALRYIEKSSRYFAEMDLTHHAGEEMMNFFLLPKGTSLSSLYPARHFAKMEKILLKSFGFELSRFKQFIPFYIQTLAGELVLDSQHILPLDYFLWVKASDSGKRMGGVESQARQIEILSKIPLNLQVRSLKLLARNPGKFKKTIQKLNTAYELSEIFELYKITKKQLGALRALLLTERNKKMAESMIQQSGWESSFFAVGAAHLAGKNGILAKLKEEGFDVRPVFR